MGWFRVARGAGSQQWSREIRGIGVPNVVAHAAKFAQEPVHCRFWPQDAAGKCGQGFLGFGDLVNLPVLKDLQAMLHAAKEDVVLS
jgi:hypothetical protein